MTLGSANFAIPHHPFPTHHSVTHGSHHSAANNFAEHAALSAFSAAGGAHSWAYPGSYGPSGLQSAAASSMDNFQNYHLSGNPYLEERSRHYGAAGNPCSSFGDTIRNFHQEAFAAAAANAVTVGAMGASNAFYPSPTGNVWF